MTVGSFRPAAPTSCLPPLVRLTSITPAQIIQALDNLRTIYIGPAPCYPLRGESPLAKARVLPKHVLHDVSVPDSGYASAEEDEEDDEMIPGKLFDIDTLRADTFERDHAIRWLTTFTARSDIWVSASDSDADARASLVDDAAALLSFFAGDAEEGDEAITRPFDFPKGETAGTVHVELNDAPLLNDDHTSVGLQSWASAIILAERMCTAPSTFGLGGTSLKSAQAGSKDVRILELGAGTGLLSIVAAKLLESDGKASQTIVATDYHSSVLENLAVNLKINFPSTSPSPVSVLPLDWEHPVYAGPLGSPFDIIFAADCVYHPSHARWIRDCVVGTLVQPHGVFWMIMALRLTGRHEGMYETVEAVFPRAGSASTAEAAGKRKGLQLAIMNVQHLGRKEGVGRADEGSYRLFKIGWAPT
ncbi:hypothetical protein CERSUDRAFT_110851 [Gelatoporia subvermispora B]|uniref:Uncharacterized protein n=1 Tax=Ceriporiopsis subvermispora (strain B) TaxID=914234 RepID=M2RV42_CERS8|nr:hypothetical protein CERSUDRAFT_110851 [Gelatoporia subvermispora B]